jgi:hypothetical protein
MADTHDPDRAPDLLERPAVRKMKYCAVENFNP